MDGLVFVIVLGIWVLMIWWGAALAKNRGRPQWVGAVLGLVLGIFGVIIMAMVPTSEEALRRRYR